MTTRRNSRSVRKQQDENMAKIQDFQLQLREALTPLHEVQTRMLTKSERSRKTSELIKRYLLSLPWGKGIKKPRPTPKDRVPNSKRHKTFTASFNVCIKQNLGSLSEQKR
eukprot:UN03919